MSGGGAATGGGTAAMLCVVRPVSACTCLASASCWISATLSCPRCSAAAGSYPDGGGGTGACGCTGAGGGGTAAGGLGGTGVGKTGSGCGAGGCEGCAAL